MAFSSNIFLFLFLPLVIAGYHILRKELRNVFLLAASLAFFAWAELKAVPVLLAVIAISYFGALLIGKMGKGAAAKAVLALAVVLDAGILVYFKYTNFLIDTVNHVAGASIAMRDIVLPVGISFFVFQSISYLTDVYRQKVQPQRSLVKTALYFAFFPKLTQGPIMRYGDMEAELSERSTSGEDMAEGVVRFVVGLTKKLLIADTLGAVADPIFALDPSGMNAALAWGGILAYSLQIYFDFCGYTDMAIGLGRMFGFHLTENFNYPYISRSITEFWRRWHISLSSWFKDYIYIPLGGNRRGNQYFNLSVVFLVTGIWHGSAWNFIVWGVFHGAFNMLEKVLMKKGLHQKIPAMVQWAVTMLLVMVGWVFFRASSLTGALEYIAAMFGMAQGAAVQYRLGWFYTNKVALITVIGLLAAVPWAKFFPKAAKALDGTYLWLSVRFVAVIVMLALSVMLAMTSTYTSFIYFQF